MPQIFKVSGYLVFLWTQEVKRIFNAEYPFSHTDHGDFCRAGLLKWPHVP